MTQPEIVLGILQGISEDDWFESKHGQIFEWGFDIDTNLHRWFKLSFERDAPPAFQKEKMLPFKDLELFGLAGNVVYKFNEKTDSYEVFE